MKVGQTVQYVVGGVVNAAIVTKVLGGGIDADARVNLTVFVDGTSRMYPAYNVMPCGALDERYNQPTAYYVELKDA